LPLQIIANPNTVWPFLVQHQGDDRYTKCTDANPNTVWPFLVQHQGDDRYTKCTEHLKTSSLGNADCVYSTVACQIIAV